jgi:hypothetical protein
MKEWDEFSWHRIIHMADSCVFGHELYVLYKAGHFLTGKLLADQECYSLRFLC